MRVIGLSGYARTGKDAVAEILVENHGFERIGFADALKDLMLRLDPYTTTTGTRLSTIVANYGWERAKDTFPEVRRLLQALGVAARDLLDPDVWVNAVVRQLREDRRYVIPDVRFPNELAAVRELGGLTVRIERPGYGPINGHISETALDGAHFSYTLVNDCDIEELPPRVQSLVATAEWRSR